MRLRQFELERDYPAVLALWQTAGPGLHISPSDTPAELARKLEALEGKYDRQFKVVFDAIRQLMSPPLTGRKQIGFRSRSVKK